MKILQRDVPQWALSNFDSEKEREMREVKCVDGIFLREY